MSVQVIDIICADAAVEAQHYELLLQRPIKQKINAFVTFSRKGLRSVITRKE